MRRISVFISLALLLVGSLQAQETTPQPIFDLLHYIPTVDNEHDIISLIDYAAIVRAYPAAERPATLAELLRTGDEDAPLGQKVWWQVFRLLQNPIGTTITRNSVLPQQLGFDYMQLDAVGIFGSPPRDGIILTGNFDTEAVTTALSARDYTLTDDAVWCYQGDCSNGLMQNLKLREPSNPFGGNLGRQQPILVSETALVSSADDAVVTAVAALTSDDADSLAADPDYQAIATILSREGLVIQTTFIGGDTLLTTSNRNTANPLDTSTGLAPIAPYRLYAMADTVDDSTQVAVAAFVFEREADATAALDQMIYRLNTLESLVVRRAWRAMLDEYNVTLSSAVVPANDRFVALLRFSTSAISPAALLAGVSEDGVVLPGMLYRVFLYGTLMQRDESWRLWDAPAP